jgi:hypothetical protein
MIALEF